MHTAIPTAASSGTAHTGAICASPIRTTPDTNTAVTLRYNTTLNCITHSTRGSRWLSLLDPPFWRVRFVDGRDGQFLNVLIKRLDVARHRRECVERSPPTMPFDVSVHPAVACREVPALGATIQRDGVFGHHSLTSPPNLTKAAEKRTRQHMRRRRTSRRLDRRRRGLVSQPRSPRPCRETVLQSPRDR